MTSLADKVALVKELDAKRTQGEWEVTGYEIHNGIEHCEIVADLEFANTPEINKANCAFIAHAPQMASIITQLWDENQKQREVLGLARVSLNKAKRAINGREHTGFIDTALTAIDKALGETK